MNINNKNYQLSWDYNNLFGLKIQWWRDKTFIKPGSKLAVCVLGNNIVFGEVVSVEGNLITSIWEDMIKPTVWEAYGRVLVDNNCYILFNKCKRFRKFYAIAKDDEKLNFEDKSIYRDRYFYV